MVCTVSPSVCLFVCLFVCVCVCVRVRVSVSVRMCVRVRVCVGVRMRVRVFVLMYYLIAHGFSSKHFLPTCFQLTFSLGHAHFVGEAEECHDTHICTFRNFLSFANAVHRFCGNISFVCVGTWCF